MRVLLVGVRDWGRDWGFEAVFEGFGEGLRCLLGV